MYISFDGELYTGLFWGKMGLFWQNTGLFLRCIHRIWRNLFMALCQRCAFGVQFVHTSLCRERVCPEIFVQRKKSPIVGLFWQNTGLFLQCIHCIWRNLFMALCQRCALGVQFVHTSLCRERECPEISVQRKMSPIVRLFWQNIGLFLRCIHRIWRNLFMALCQRCAFGVEFVHGSLCRALLREDLYTGLF